jgi:hypothetical protein
VETPARAATSRASGKRSCPSLSSVVFIESLLSLPPLQGLIPARGPIRYGGGRVDAAGRSC